MAITYRSFPTECYEPFHSSELNKRLPQGYPPTKFYPIIEEAWTAWEDQLKQWAEQHERTARRFREIAATRQVVKWV